MGRVIDFAKYRRQRRDAPDPPTAQKNGVIEGDSIQIKRRDDGTRSVTLRGIYAEDHPYAIEALAEVISKLTAALRHKVTP